VHAAYEEVMVDYHVSQIIGGVTQRANASQPLSPVSGGQGAAIAVVDLMQRTFATIAPSEIVDAFVAVADQTPKPRAMALWDTPVREQSLGDRTMDVMADGCLTLAQIWESAWIEGKGDSMITDLSEVAVDALTQLYQNPDFLPSKTLDTIGPLLEPTAPSAQPTRPKTGSALTVRNGGRSTGPQKRRPARKKHAQRSIA
jgi:hypothetical protein